MKIFHQNPLYRQICNFLINHSPADYALNWSNESALGNYFRRKVLAVISFLRKKTNYAR